jgi:Protein of unknown function (DUF2752)
MKQASQARAARSFSFPSGAVLLSLICAGILILSFLLPPEGLLGVETCSFHALTGLSCPGCGLTRAFVAISHARFYQAWFLHPFAFPLYGACVASLPAPIIPKALAIFWNPRIAKMGILLFAAGLLLFGSWRMVREFKAARTSRASTLSEAP